MRKMAELKKGQNTTALPVQGEKAGNIVPEENTPVAADALSEKIRELYGTSRFRANFLPFRLMRLPVDTARSA